MANIRGNHLNNGLVGTNRNDRINGRGGNDILIGRDGNDNIIGGKGNDTLLGGSGDDRLEGGRGNDTLIGHAGQDTFVIDYKSKDRDTIIDFTKGQDSFRIKNFNKNNIGLVSRYDRNLSYEVQYARDEGVFYGHYGIFAKLSRAQYLTMADFL